MPLIILVSIWKSDAGEKAGIITTGFYATKKGTQKVPVTLVFETQSDSAFKHCYLPKLNF